MLKSAAVLACLLVPIVASADDAATSASAVAPSSVAGSIAAPSDDLPAPPAPVNEPWSNVSHINGQLVPVGERNRYLYSYKKTNLQVNPFGFIAGYYSVAASHALSGNLALSVELSYMSEDGETGTQVAASLPIYFKHTFSGPFLEPGVLTRSGDGDSFTGIEMMFGWAWMFDSGLNVSAAFGAAKRVGTGGEYQDDDYYYEGDNLEPAGYFRVGYAF